MHRWNEDREQHLDGLRGIAACIVVLFHLTAGEVSRPFYSYWEQPNEERYLIQLPPFRIWIAGQAMVQLFFVVSGYSLARSVRRYIRKSSAHRYICAAIARRFLRLYIPVVVISMLSHCIWYFGLYSWGVLTPTCPDAIPLSSPWPHIKCFLSYTFNVLNFMEPDVVREPDRRGLNIAFWTIPLEFRGSVAVYLTLLALEKIRTKARAVAVGILCIFCFWSSTFGLLPFFLGLLQEELRTLWEEDSFGELSAQSNLSILLSTGALGLGIYIMSLPFNEDRITADWCLQMLIRSPALKDMERCQMRWYAIGAAMITASLNGLKNVRDALGSRALQFLGRISFSLYLVHITVILVLRILILNVLCWIFTGDLYDGVAIDVSQGRAFVLIWALCCALHFIILVPLAFYLTKHLDERSARWARDLETFIQEKR